VTAYPDKDRDVPTNLSPFLFVFTFQTKVRPVAEVATIFTRTLPSIESIFIEYFVLPFFDLEIAKLALSLSSATGIVLLGTKVEIVGELIGTDVDVIGFSALVIDICGPPKSIRCEKLASPLALTTCSRTHATPVSFATP